VLVDGEVGSPLVDLTELGIEKADDGTFGSMQSAATPSCCGLAITQTRPRDTGPGCSPATTQGIAAKDVRRA
jgi:hypothetical protein